MNMPVKTIIMGAAGRDFHNFNTFFRLNKDYEVVAFTATQIPDIEGRLFPPELSGALYPKGIPIRAESELPDLIRKHGAEQVIFAYSDVTHEYVMHKAALVNPWGRLPPEARYTQIKPLPVVSICAVHRLGQEPDHAPLAHPARTRLPGGCHSTPMPYGNLIRQEVQRFADYDDLDEHETTIEEREEYEPHIDNGVLVFAGVDYEKIVRAAEKEVDIVLWDGGNNDLPFYVPDYQIVVADRTGPA
jgi:predicted GTPase